MSESGSALLNQPEQNPGISAGGQKRVTELRVSGHLMTLDTGVFCVFQTPGSAVASDGSGLPGVRISLPPGPAGNPDAVNISTFNPDGWLGSRDGAALVRVSEGPAQVLVTVYQSPMQGVESAPRLQVLRLSGDAAQAGARQAAPAAANDEPAAPAAVLLHMQRAGDIAGAIGEWLGERGSKLWIEGFAITPPAGVPVEDIEYQAVLGRGWSSPWVEGGTFCGSRGMALPLLGIRMRLKGEAADAYALRYAATFVDGTEIGPVEAGEACEAESLAALEAMQIILEPRAVAGSSRQKLAAPSPVGARKPPVRTPAPAPAAARRAR